MKGGFLLYRCRVCGKRYDGVHCLDVLLTVSALMTGMELPKVRNLVCHRDRPGNIIHEGYADYDDQRAGLTITDAGKAYLDSLQP